jgi:hypothetical protein
MQRIISPGCSNRLPAGVLTKDFAGQLAGGKKGTPGVHKMKCVLARGAICDGAQYNSTIPAEHRAGTDASEGYSTHFVQGLGKPQID